ncbi:MAG: hypothetical protein D6715_00735 [Calditrichaeota bacterium]|nr:MAG: hypothetical protein D6715_00735 [Calditrichota bacterium]
MLIKNKQTSGWQRAWGAFRRRPGQILGIAFLLWIGFVGGFLFHRAGIFYNYIKPFLANALEVVQHYPKGLMVEPPRLEINIKHKHYQKLAYKRYLGLINHVNQSTAQDYVPATIRYQNTDYPVKMRLKGVFGDHWKDEVKWSFRLKVRRGMTLLGMKNLSLVNPESRNMIYEWICLQLLRRQGIPSARYQFVEVSLNGKNLGVYGVEEHLGKRLIENNRFREGPIVYFSKDLLVSEWIRGGYHGKKEVGGPAAFTSSPVVGTQWDNIVPGTPMEVLYRKAVTLLEAFRRQELPVSQVFDLPKLAKYMALKVLFGASELDPNDARFYFNPITSRLEPIGIENHFSPRVGYWWLNEVRDRKAYFVNLFFRDPEFLEAYFRALEEVSQPAFLDTFFQAIQPELEHNLAILYREYPEFKFEKSVFYKNQAYIRRSLTPVKAFHAHVKAVQGNRLILQLGNIQPLPVEILGVNLKNLHFLPAPERTVLKPKRYWELIHYQEVAFPLPEGLVWADSLSRELKVQYRILGTSRVASEDVYPWPYEDVTLVEQDPLHQPPNFRKFPFLKIDDRAKEVIIPAGRWVLRRTLIIPAGYRVLAGPEVEIDLRNGASIISRSPLEWVGIEEAPIVVTSSDSSGRGVFVYGTPDTSQLRYVVFLNLSNPAAGGWALTGSVTFYQSPVMLDHCQIVGPRSEDGLNTVRTTVSMDNCLFSASQSDAFDADFCTIAINNSRFLACGNDGIDVSGSYLTINNLLVDGVGDKAVSVGEHSFGKARFVEIRNAEIAVASKDLSSLDIRRLTIRDSRVGFTGFQKKPEFGPGKIEARKVSLSNVEVPYLIETGSSLRVDGERIKPSRKNVKEILYGVEYGKSSHH